MELVYTSTFLAMCCNWEGLLETALFEVVCGPKSKKPGRNRLASFRSRKHFKGVLLHPNRDYVGLENLNKTISLASLYVERGRPFSEVSESNKTYLGHIVQIRNAIAHQSDVAVTKFKEKVPGVDALPVHRRAPGPFLRHVFRSAPDQTRLELYIASLKSAALEIDSAW